MTRAPFQRHSKTSREAAQEIEPDVGTLEHTVLFALRFFSDDGLTDEEMQRWLGLSANTQRPRRVSLCKKGLVRDTGQVRKTASGRKATVWGAV